MRTVAVWKRVWLPPSETFVRNQMDYLSAWRSVAFGVRRMDSLLSRDSDEILFGDSVRERIALALFRLRGHSPRVTRFLIEQQVDVVHAHFGSEAVSIWRQCKKARIPLVVTLHGHDISAAPLTKGLAGWRYRRRLRSMFIYASRVIAVSNFIRQLALSQGAVDERTVVRYIGIPIEAASPDAARDAASRWDIAFVGRLAHKKGVRDLLAAVSNLSHEGIQPSVVVVGSGPLGAELRAFARQEDLKVEFLGHQSPEQVREVLAVSRIFVAPSKTAEDGDAEGFGLVFLEAAAASLPVISYAHGGVVEAVEDGVTGILCEEGNVDALTDAIRRLIANPDLAEELGRSGRARVLSDFDVKDRTRELESVYEAAVSGRA